MKNKKTVFVLGAGASKPYGFPVARELSERAIRKLTRPKQYSKSPNVLALYSEEAQTEVREYDATADLLTALHSLTSLEEFLTPHRKEFRRKFPDSLQPSVDAFVQLNRDYEPLGRALITAEILGSEDPNRPSRDLRGEVFWIEELWYQIGRSIEDAEASNIEFITFNYDRSLEFYLLKAISSSFGMGDDAAAEFLQKNFPIHHVYGSVGKLPVLAEKKETIIQYGMDVTGATTNLAMDSIRLINIRADDKDLGLIHDSLHSAEVVCFLGFAYDQQNLEVLFGEENKYPNLDSPKMYGTAFHLPKASVAKTHEFLSHVWSQAKRDPITFGDWNQTSAEFLRSTNLW